MFVWPTIRRLRKMDKNYKTWETPLLMLKLIGLYTKTGTRKVALFAIVYVMLLVFIVTMVLIQFTAIRGDIFEFIDNIEALNAYAQGFGKVLLIARQQGKLFKMLDDTKYFWKSDVCAAEIKVQLDDLATKIVRLQRTFLYCATAGTVFMEAGPLLDRSLPFGIWKLSDYKLLYRLTLIIQLIELPIMAIFVAAYDCLFLAFTTEAIIQFRILCYCLKELSSPEFTSIVSEKQYYCKIKLYIHHHVFLLRFLQSLQDYFSVGMLTEYLTISSLVCAEMYALFESTSVQLLTKHAMVFWCLLFQLALYCFGAHFLFSEACAVSDAIYNSDWYSKYSPTVLHPTTLIIQRSQRRVVFTAGGLIEMNIRTILVVLRVSWSACTLMRALKSNRSNQL